MTARNHITFCNKGQTSNKNNEEELIQPVQMNLYQINTCEIKLDWLQFDNSQGFKGSSKSKTNTTIHLFL